MTPFLVPNVAGCRGINNNILVNVLPSLHWDGALATGAYLNTNVVSSVHTQTPLTTCISWQDTNTPWWRLQSGPTVPTSDSTRRHNQHVFTTAPCPRFHTEYYGCQWRGTSAHLESQWHDNNDSRPPHSKLTPDHMTSPQLPTSLIMVLIPSTPQPEHYHRCFFSCYHSNRLNLLVCCVPNLLTCLSTQWAVSVGTKQCFWGCQSAVLITCSLAEVNYICVYHRKTFWLKWPWAAFHYREINWSIADELQNLFINCRTIGRETV